ncbi:hypothetical protein ACE3MZ_04910 [Paenibacillus sp. WLX1005]|uniref:hypothetical protein n=1 Tax=Paenibacillus sp. WLX1005 TaxID=3243766 RepID=UPI003983ECBC
MAKWFKAVWIMVVIAHVLCIINWFVMTTHVFQQRLHPLDIVYFILAGFFSFPLLAMSIAAIWFPRTRANPILNYVIGTLIMICLVYVMRWYLEYNGYSHPKS